MLAIYVSTMDPNYSRSGVFFAADPGEKIFIKFPFQRFKQIQKIFELKKLHKSKEICIVLMSPNHLLAPLFRVLTNYQIILDAGWPLSDSTYFPEQHLLKFRNILNRAIDRISFALATKVILESIEQLKFVNEKFRIPKTKLYKLYTGFNEIGFVPAMDNPKVPNELEGDHNSIKQFVFFRGKYNSESGLDLIIDASRLLPREVVIVVATNTMMVNCPGNVIIINRFVSAEELCWLYANSTLVLGQISNLSRLRRTLPHKLFEAGFFAKCYLSPPSPSLSELLDEDSYIQVLTITAEGLSQKIMDGLSNPKLRLNCEKNIYANYIKKASQPALGLKMREIIELKA